MNQTRPTTTAIGRTTAPGGDESRVVLVTVAAIVGVAAFVRFWGVGGGLPWSLGVDEPQIMVRSVLMVKTGDFNPHFFDYPGLYLYLQALVVVARFLAGASSGLWSSLDQVTDYDFYLWGRAVTAAFGTATVYLLYRAGARWGVRQGLVAAAALAVLPIHVRESHYVLTDVPMTFFVVLAFLLALRALERGTPAAFAWAGAAAGLAAGTKYTAWVAILLALVAAGFIEASFATRARRALAAVAGFVAAFLFVAPYTALDLPGFLNGFGALSAGVPARPASLEPGWMVYLKHLRMTLGWPASAVAALGALMFAWRAAAGPDRARFAMVVPFLALFWLMIIDRTLIFGRYLMPALPFVCLLVGVAFVALVDWSRDLVEARPLVRRAAVAIVLAVVLGQPARTSVLFARQAGYRSTEALAMDWVQANVRPGARIVHESESLHFPPGRYELTRVGSLIEKDRDFYSAENVDYVVATSSSFGRSFGDPRRFRTEYLAYRWLFDHLVLVHTVTPSSGHPGPEMRIFAVPRASAP